MRPNNGYSIYGKRMYGNLNPNPNPNPYMPQNPHYNNQYLNNNYNYPRPNPYQPYQNPKVNQNINNNIVIKKKVNNKYDDLELKANFSDNNHNNNLSANDLEIQNELDTITNQYMIIFNNINELNNGSSKSNNNMNNNDLNIAKQELDRVDHQNGNEYSNFLGQLYEVSKDDNILNMGYDSYKKDHDTVDEEIKKIINNFKYDIVLFSNKNNVTKEVYQKLEEYINKKKPKKENNEFNIIQSNNPKNNNNLNSIISDSDYKNKNNNHNNNLIFEDENNTNENGFNLLNDNLSDENEKKEEIKQNFEDPNDISDYNKFNLYESSKKESEPIKVTFNIDGNKVEHEVKSDESGEVLYLFAMQEKDEPVIFTEDGNKLTYEDALKLTVGEIFKNCEPILNVY